MGPRPLRRKHRILNTELLTLKKHGLPQGSAGKSRICYLNWDLEEVCLSAQAAMIKYQVLGGFNRNWFSHNLGTGGLRPELECGRLLERALLLACRQPFLAVSSHGGGKEQAVLGLPLFCSDAQSCPILCDPMACSTPGSSVLHCLLQLAQAQVHRVSDAIQHSHPLASPSPFAFNPSQHQSLFHWVSLLHQVAKVLEF